MRHLVCHPVWMTVWYAASCLPDSHPHRITSTKCRIHTVVPPDDGHIVARNMQRQEINILRKTVQQVAFVYKITRHNSVFGLYSFDLKESLTMTPRSPVQYLSKIAFIYVNASVDMLVTIHLCRTYLQNVLSLSLPVQFSICCFNNTCNIKIVMLKNKSRHQAKLKHNILINMLN